MTRLKYLGRKPYRVLFRDKLTILTKGDVIELPDGQVKLKKMRSFENLDEKTRRDKELNEKIRKITEVKEMNP